MSKLIVFSFYIRYRWGLSKHNFIVSKTKKQCIVLFCFVFLFIIWFWNGMDTLGDQQQRFIYSDVCRGVLGQSRVQKRGTSLSPSMANKITTDTDRETRKFSFRRRIVRRCRIHRNRCAPAYGKTESEPTTLRHFRNYFRISLCSSHIFH